MKFILFDIKSADLNSIVSALSRFLNMDVKKYDRDEAYSLLSKLREMGYELFTKPVPLPEDRRMIDVLKGSDIEVIPHGTCKISPEVLELLAEFCKTLREPFRIIDYFSFDNIDIIVGEIFDRDEICVLETNLDDVSGEIISNAVNRLSEEALDVSVIQCIGKKGRPAVMIRVLSRLEDCHRIAKIIMEETGTLGVRINRVHRIVERRDVRNKEIELFGRRFNVRFKVSTVSTKPEFEDVKKISEELKIPLPIVYREVIRRMSDEAINR